MDSCKISPERVREKAYQIYLQRGCQPGHDIDDWLQAEYELMQLPVETIAQLEPPKSTKSRKAGHALVAAVHTALFLAGVLPHWKR